MLPFLKRKQTPATGLIVKSRSPEAEEPVEDKDASIKACAFDLIAAVHAKDVNAAASAIRSAFEILDSQPHEEGEHISQAEPHSYDAQNQKAVK